MTSVERKAYQATWEVISTGKCALPLPAWAIFSFATYARRIWRFYRRAKVYTNPDNFFQLAAGQLLFSSQNRLTHLSSRLVLIALRLQECVDQLLAFRDACDELKYSWKGEYAKPISVSWIKGDTAAFFSPSTIIWWREKWQDLVQRISRIFFSLIRIIKAAFLLSMHVMDTVEAFFYSEDIQRESEHELLVNGSLLLKRLTQDRQNTLSVLQKHSGFLDHLLLKIGAGTTTASLIQNLVEATQESGGFLANYGKKLLFQGARTIGCHQILPAHLLPPPTLSSRREVDQFFPRPPYPSLTIHMPLLRRGM